MILGRDKEISEWVGGLVGMSNFGPCIAIGISDGKDTLLGGAVFNNYRWPNIEVTMASVSKRWCTRAVLWKLFHYPFVQLNCRRLTATTEATNQPVRAFLCHLGFHQEGYHPDALPTGDAVSFGMLRRDCRWLEEPRRHASTPPDCASASAFVGQGLFHAPTV